MEHSDNVKGATLQDVKAMPTQDPTARDSVAEGRVIHEVPELLSGMSDEELSAASRKLVRKLDLRLMAPLILMYIMNYLDRSGSYVAHVCTH